MSLLTAIPVLKEFINWIRNTETIELLKADKAELKAELSKVRDEHKAELKATEKAYKAEIARYRKIIKSKE